MHKGSHVPGAENQLLVASQVMGSLSLNPYRMRDARACPVDARAVHVIQSLGLEPLVKAAKAEGVL